MSAIRMTEGSITRHLIHYSVPLILGNYFQLTYNVVDSVIAGHFIGKEALAAEGTASPVMNIVTLGIASAYLSIIFLGAPFTYFYNAISAALKSVGDSKTPLKFLAFSSVLNAVLDLIFIGALGFGIVCSALTTVIAQAVSAILCVVYVYRKIPLLQLRRNELHIDGALLKQTLSHGITTFVAQNRGAGKKERIRNGFRRGLLLELGYWALICCVTLTCRQFFMHLFVTKEQTEIAALGCSYLAMMGLFYLLPAFTNGFQGFFRGMGNMRITLLGTFVQTSLRVVFVYLLTPRIGLTGVAYACAIGWSVMLLVEVPYYFHLAKGIK